MKAVIISTQPKWCELIASGKKTVEVRKTKPKLETPFKVYIYCTKDNFKSIFQEKPYLMHNRQICNSKVIGEFVCDCIISHCEMANADIAEQQGCIKREKLFEYANGKELYGWHISDLVIYDKPKELSEFYNYDTTYNNSFGWAFSEEEKRTYLKRPPQSWCYVEAVSV